jgi:hypothetical protein
VPLTKIPFKAGWGNDTGQPNLGDYNQSVSQHGELFAAYAVTSRPPGGFVDGQPSTRLSVPNIEFKRVRQFSPIDVNSLPLSIDVNAVSTDDVLGNRNGFLDPGETIRLRIGLTNYTTNNISDAPARNVSALLFSDTPGVTVLQPIGTYGTIVSGDTDTNSVSYLLRLSSGFDPGTLINLRLQTFGRFGPGNSIDLGTLRHVLFTGTPQTTTLFTENFDATAVGALPAGWVSSHGGGVNTVPWVTSNTFCGTSNAAFHQNADDNPAGGDTRWERLFSPNFVVPSDSDYVLLEFDVCTDTEDDPNFNVQAFDGLTLRIADFTTGNTLRSVLVEAWADEFTTNGFKHFPKHLPRSGNPAYFQDMSVWAGDSGGPMHVRMRLPGMANTTAQLRFEYTQDGIATCLDVGGGPVCGVSVDNIVIRSVKEIAAPVRAAGAR